MKFVYLSLLGTFVLSILSGCGKKNFYDSPGIYRISSNHSIVATETEEKLACKIENKRGENLSKFGMPVKAGWFIYPVNENIIWVYDGGHLAYCYTDKGVGIYESGLYDMPAKNVSDSVLNAPEAFIERLALVESDERKRNANKSMEEQPIQPPRD